MTRREKLLVILLLGLGILVRLLRLQELALHPEWLVPDKDQVDMAFFYNYGQDLAAKCRDFLGIPKPEPNPLPPSPVNWTQSSNEGFMRPPGYSFFLAGLFLLSGNQLLVPIMAQMVLGLINALLAWRLARRAGGPVPALITLAFMLFYWVLMVYEGVYHAQVLMIFHALLLLNALEWWSIRPSPIRAAMAGLALTLNMLVTPSISLFAPVAALWMLLWLTVSGDSWKNVLTRAFRHITTTAVASALLVSPVTWSNWKTDGIFSLVSRGGGVILLIGNHDGADGYYRDPLKQFGFEDTGDHEENCRLFEKATGIKVTPKTMEQVSSRFAVEWILNNPGKFLRLTVKRALIYWQPKEVSHNVQEYCTKRISRVLRWLPGGFPEILGALGVAAVMGLWSCRRADPWTRLRWMLPFLYSLVFYLPFTVFYFAGHYRVPILPFLAMMGAGGVCAALAHLRTRPLLAITALSCGLVLWLGTRIIPVDYEADWERWIYYRSESTLRLQGEQGLTHMETLLQEAGLTDSPSICLFMARRASERKDFNTVIMWCQRGLEHETSSTQRRVWLLQLLTSALAATGADTTDSEAAFRELVSRDPQNFLGRIYLANKAIAGQNYVEAIVHLQAALEANPNNGNAWFLLGNCQMAMGFPQQAEEAYRKGMENDPADPWPAMGLAGVLETQGRLDEARQAAEEALRRDPSIQAARDMLNRLNQHGTASTPSPDTPGAGASSTPPGRDQVPGDPGSIPASP